MKHWPNSAIPTLKGLIEKVAHASHRRTYPGLVVSCVSMGCLATPMENLRPTGVCSFSVDTHSAIADLSASTLLRTEMYPGMAKSAREENFVDVAEWFETLAKAEKSHAGRFQKALDGLEKL